MAAFIYPPHGSKYTKPGLLLSLRESPGQGASKRTQLVLQVTIYNEALNGLSINKTSNNYIYVSETTVQARKRET